MTGENIEKRSSFDNRALFGAVPTLWCKLSKINMKNNQAKSNRSQYDKLESVIGCKWSVSVLMAIGDGVNRPGALARHINGISAKVLSERLRKLTDYALLQKETFPQVPPRTEYALTQAGHALIEIIQKIHKLDESLNENDPDTGSEKRGDATPQRKK